MGLKFWGKKKKQIRKTRKKRTRFKHETMRRSQSQRREDEILMKLDAIMTFLRKHDLDMRDEIDQIAVAKRILKVNNLNEIIKDKLSQNMTAKDIVKELVSDGKCSRSTAYRYISRLSETIKVPIKSH